MSAPRNIGATDGVAAHLAACCDALYRALGECAGSFDVDAHVVLAYELARTFGDLRMRFDELGPRRADVSAPHTSVPVIGDVVSEAASVDPSGALALYCVSSLVGPRLLISLRDAAESSSSATEGPLRGAAQDAAQVVIGSLHRIGATARGPDLLDEPTWRALANGLDRQISQCGYGESFGLGHVG